MRALLAIIARALTSLLVVLAALSVLVALVAGDVDYAASREIAQASAGLDPVAASPARDPVADVRATLVRLATGELRYRDGAKALIADDLSRALRMTLAFTVPAFLLSLGVAYFAAPLLLYAERALPRRLNLGPVFLAANAVPVLCTVALLQALSGVDSVIAGVSFGPLPADAIPRTWSLAELMVLWAHLPAAILIAAYPSALVLSHYLYVGLRETLDARYIAAARARGIGDWRLIQRHALPNAMLAYFVHLGELIPALLGGSVMVETLFQVPGMGTLALHALFNRELDLIFGIATLSTLGTVLGYAATDLLVHARYPHVRDAP